jgi:putative DNA primase/helicase
LLRAYHPDLESAILAIGSDGVTRAHVGSALGHLQRANKKATAEELVVMLEDECNRHRAEIEDNLARNNESNEVWDDLVRYFPNDVAKAQWWIDRPAAPDIGGAADPSSEAPAFTDVEKAREEMARAAITFLKHHVLCPEDESNPFIRHGQKRDADLIDLALLPAIVARVTTGVGKTQLMAKAIAIWLGMVEIPSITYAVPRHKLGKKILQQFTEHGVFAKIIRGRHALDPRAHPDGEVKHGEPRVEMCLNPEATRLAEDLQVDVEKNCCKTKKHECPFYNQCGYQQQKRGPKARVWIVASDMLFHNLPLLKDTAAVIIDEAFWQKGLDGFDGQYTIPINSLCEPDVNLPEDESKLRTARNKLAKALADQEDDGGVRGSTLYMFTRKELFEIRHREWDMLPKSPLLPGMDEKEIRRIAHSTKPTLNKMRHSRKVIKIWDGVMELVGNYDLEVSGRLTLKRDTASNFRMIAWRGIKEITKQFKVPVFIMDATAPDLKILRAFYPMAELGVKIDVEMPSPHVHVRQILEAPTSANKLLKPEDDKNREDVRRHILQRWLETGSADTLVICQMKYQEWLEPKDANNKPLPRRLPDNIRVEHFNDITGIDDFRDVRLLLVIGRTAPGPRTDEAYAAAISGEQPTTMPERGTGLAWYDRVVRGIRMRDGSGVLTMVDQHRDPIAEAVRWQIVEAELIQAIGRARGVNRTAESPLDIDLLFDVDLGITVDEAPSWAVPSTLIETAAEAGVMLTAPTDMARAFPNIWPTKRAADRTLKAGVPELPGFRSESYQAPGSRQKHRMAYTNLEPEAWRTWCAARGWKPAELEPWEAAGVSRATYFRRLKAKSAFQ